MKYPAEEYYDKLAGKKVIAIDFDNTVCLDEWPYIGPVINDAISVIKELARNGHRLILFTQRESQYPICCKELQEYTKTHGSFMVHGDGRVPGGLRTDILSDAIKIFDDNNIELTAINRNPDWEYTSKDYGRKLFADYFIDDHNVGMKYIIVINKFGEKCKVCDWKFIDEWFVNEGLYKNRVFS